MKGLTFKRTFWVCKRCQAVYHHPIKYCYECPGEMEQRTYDYPSNLDYTETNFKKWVAKFGLHFNL